MEARVDRRSTHGTPWPRGRGRALVLSTLLLFVAAPGDAETLPAANLDSLLAIAFRVNPKLLAIEAAHRAALERIPRAGALPDPMLSFSAEGAPLTDPSPTEAMEKKIMLSQMFPFPGKQGLMKSAMATEAEMARAQFDRARLDVAADLHKAFYDLHLLYESIDVLEESRGTVQTFADIARTKYEVGTAEQQDVLKAMVELAQENNRLVILRERIPAAVARINAILDRPSQEPLGRPALPDPTMQLPEPGVLERKALELQPMLKMKEWAVAKSEYDLRLARKEALPDFTVGVEYMGLREAADAWTLMLGLTLPVWRGNKVAPLRREAEQSLRSTRSDRDQTQNEVVFMVRDAYTMASTSKTLVELYRDSVLPQAQQSLASARAAYETDRVGFLELLDAQRSLLDFRLEYQDALAMYLKSLADLGVAVGDFAMLGVSHE
jgi:outer membrane protein TolC